jgi:hypothetical protein
MSEERRRLAAVFAGVSCERTVQTAQVQVHRVRCSRGPARAGELAQLSRASLVW